MFEKALFHMYDPLQGQTDLTPTSCLLGIYDLVLLA